MVALVAACCVPINSWAAQVTFKTMYNDSKIEIPNRTPEIYVYKGGEQINSNSYMYDGECTCYLDDSYVGQTVSYRSSIGHEGKITVTDGAVINLNCQKVTITTKNSEGTALSWESVYIYNANGSSILSASTNYGGEATVYLATADEYAYKWESGNQSGSFALNSDYVLNLVAGSGGGGDVSTKYDFKVIARYGDFPVTTDGYASYYLYRYGDKNNSINSVGTYTTKVEPGSYWIRDGIGAFSKKIEVTGDMTAYLDYKKVSFVSKTGSTPNADQSITISSDQSENYYYGSTRTITTNSKGVATTYLLPGEYVYAIAGAQTKFTVEEEDKIVNINTSKVTISLNCDNIVGLKDQRFEWGTITSGGYYSYNDVRQSDGKIIINTMPGNYKLRINGVSEVDVTVTTGENNVPVQLYYIMFTTNLSTPGNIYIGNNGQTFGFNTKYYLASGEYSYGTSSYSSNQTPFTLNGNKSIALNYATLTVIVKDTKGNAVAGQYVYINPGGSTRTDSNGKAVGTFLYGSYTVYAESYQDLGQTVELTGDKFVTITIPALVSFSVLENGQPVSGYGSGSTFSLYPNKDRRTSGVPVYVNNGSASARVEPGKTYYLSGYQGPAVITEGGTLSLGTLSVSCEGMGLAFPMENWDAVSTYPVIVGSTVRLTAIPVSDDKFQYWTINGSNHNSPVIDLKLTQPNTTAKAIFSGAITSAAKTMLSGLTFDIDDNYIYLGDDTEGTAKIYTSDGRLVKEIGVVGGQIGIYDLSTGTYILSFRDESGVKSTRFSKK